MTWRTAADTCRTNNSHLVHIKTREVTVFIHELVRNASLDGDDDVFIGELTAVLLICKTIIFKQIAGNRRLISFCIWPQYSV